MADTTEDLSMPLGQNSAPRRRLRFPFTLPQAAGFLLGSILVVFLGFVFFNHDPLGGEPVARVVIRHTPVSDEKSAATRPASQQPDSAAVATRSATGQKTITIIDGSSGSRQDVVVAGPDSDAADARSEAAATGIHQRLLEKSRYGMIPVVAADGLKAFKAYAMGTEADRAKAATMPVVAIVVSGLGIGTTKTIDAIMKLPSAVTLAFTPYSSDPGKLVEQARAQHHEVLLQLPMEPHDYPDNDPGPQTLLTTLGTDQNIDRLRWQLSRFQGYVGLTNFMGARFVTAVAAMQPIIREAAKRGLGYLDDGTAPTSVAGQLAKGQAMPFIKADLTIDAVPTSVEIDKTLARLEELAKGRGTAVGMTSALPVSIDRVGAWIKGLESRGVMLVPLTTAMLKSKSN
ncbi:divergent polysaccharide deacetylase family protein [Nitrobacter sp.]|uniref:divergent polysaccharide deacetylase family protein n=1 Tax=Nitrobacter sp. TaxID=29420 RepID=UPI001DB17B07|nr:divergent polysaccharide deacetylase family protein [Nitrobacter sp.]MCB1393720.1 divergent polysaccharide deacetylase family protein [Nitrobacter sp.]